MFGDSLRPEETACIGATVQLVRTYSESIYLDRSFCLTLLSFLSPICRDIHSMLELTHCLPRRDKHRVTKQHKPRPNGPIQS